MDTQTKTPPVSICIDNEMTTGYTVSKTNPKGTISVHDLEMTGVLLSWVILEINKINT